MHRQPSLFGVGATDPTPDDLVGLLAGPGRPGRMGGTGRVSVEVDAAWRVHALMAELATRHLAASWEPGERPGWYVVRTAYTVRLARLVAAWLDDGGKRSPPRLFLGGHALRLWVAAAGTCTADGYLLRLDRDGDRGWPQVGEALRAVGLPAALVTSSDQGPAYRITGRRRLARLVELIGERPAVVPPQAWPDALATAPP